MVTFINKISVASKLTLEDLDAIIEENKTLHEQVELFKKYSQALEVQIIERDKVIQSYHDLCSESDRLYEEIERWTPTSDDEAFSCEAKGDNLHELESSHTSQLPDPTSPSAPRILHGEWVIEPQSADTPIAYAESLIMANKMQAALAHLDTGCQPTSRGPALYINAKLLKSCVLRSIQDPKRALELAETALFLAHINDLRGLVSKAQFHRGLALFDLELFAEAQACFVRAASIQWYARDVERMSRKAEMRKRELPKGRRGKYVSADFEIIPKSNVSVSAFGAVNP